MRLRPSEGEVRVQEDLTYAVDVVVAKGHPNVRALHETTLEITRDEHLTSRGDCIVGVGASKGAAALSERLKAILRSPGSTAYLVIEAGELREIVRGSGDPRLTLSDERSMVFRKSSYVDGRTVIVRADKAAADLDRALVEELKREARLVAYLVASLEPVDPLELLRL